MKKYMGISILLCVCGFISAAQVQRIPQQQKKDSSALNTVPENKDSRKEMFRELNLTKEQGSKLKELNQSMKASKEAIEADTTLSEPEKRSKLKILRKEQSQKIQALLTEEQKIKFRELRAKNGIE